MKRTQPGRNDKNGGFVITGANRITVRILLSLCWFLPGVLLSVAYASLNLDLLDDYAFEDFARPRIRWNNDHSLYCLASGGETVVIGRVVSGQLWERHRENAVAYACEFLSGGNFIIVSWQSEPGQSSAGLSDHLELFDITDLKNVKILEAPGYTTRVYSIAVNAAHGWMAVGDSNATISVHNVTSVTEISFLGSLTHDYRYMSDQWEDGSLAKEYAKNQAAVFYLQFHPDPHKKVLASIAGFSANLWDISIPNEPVLIKSIPLVFHYGELVFSPDGQLLIIGVCPYDADQTDQRCRKIAFYDIQNLDDIKRLPLLECGSSGSFPALGLAINSDGTLLITAGGTPRIILWDIRDRAAPEKLDSWEHLGETHTVAFVPTKENGQILSTASECYRGSLRLTPGHCDWLLSHNASMNFKLEELMNCHSSKASLKLFNITDKARVQPGYHATGHEITELCKTFSQSESVAICPAIPTNRQSDSDSVSAVNGTFTVYRYPLAAFYRGTSISRCPDINDEDGESDEATNEPGLTSLVVMEYVEPEPLFGDAGDGYEAITGLSPNISPVANYPGSVKSDPLLDDDWTTEIITVTGAIIMVVMVTSFGVVKPFCTGKSIK